jgi:hypothetical protein
MRERDSYVYLDRSRCHYCDCAALWAQQCIIARMTEGLTVCELVGEKGIRNGEARPIYR